MVMVVAQVPHDEREGRRWQVRLAGQAQGQVSRVSHRSGGRWGHP
jgi:hypothetical protein